VVHCTTTVNFFTKKYDGSSYKRSPSGKICRCHPSDKVQTHLFGDGFQNFIYKTKSSANFQILLNHHIFHGHSRNTDMIELAWENVRIISNPPHTTRKLQHSWDHKRIIQRNYWSAVVSIRRTSRSQRHCRTLQIILITEPNRVHASKRFQRTGIFPSAKVVLTGVALEHDVPKES
jgi:hypothetical protein